jgi:hypothetical protein
MKFEESYRAEIAHYETPFPAREKAESAYKKIVVVKYQFALSFFNVNKRVHAASLEFAYFLY